MTEAYPGARPIATLATLPGTADERAQRARRGLAVYFALVVLLTGMLDVAIIRNPEFDSLALATMLVPAIASVVARLALREGFGDVSFRIGGWRTWKIVLLAPVFPLVVCSIAYGVGWSTGLVQFAPQPVGPFLIGIAVVLLPSVILVSGEEIGWRGYMLTRLIDARVPHPLVANGLIWGMWHTPLLLAGIWAAGPSPILSAVLAVGMMTAYGCVIARVRLVTGSVWTAVAFHFAWNRIIQSGFDAVSGGPGARLWLGESGILTAIVVLSVVGALVWAERTQLLQRLGWTTEPRTL
jgi:membrane protease YdiL (CAAX protease family)